MANKDTIIISGDLDEIVKVEKIKEFDPNKYTMAMTGLSMAYYNLNQLSVYSDGYKATDEQPEGVERLSSWFTGTKIIPYTRLETLYFGKLNELRRHHSPDCGLGASHWGSSEKSWIINLVQAFNNIFRIDAPNGPLTHQIESAYDMIKSHFKIANFDGI